MLRPQDTATRERKRPDGLWRFALGPAGEGRAARWLAGPLAGTREMAAPAFSTRDRQPKAAARALRRRWRKDA